jgi:hypothetical protein
MRPRHPAAALRVPVVREELQIIAAPERIDVSGGLGQPKLIGIAPDDAIFDGRPQRQDVGVVEAGRLTAVERRYVGLAGRIVPAPAINAQDALRDAAERQANVAQERLHRLGGVLADKGDEHRHVHHARLVEIGTERSGIPSSQEFLAAHVEVILGGAIKDVPCFLRREFINRHVVIIQGEANFDLSMPLSAQSSLLRRDG